MSSKTAQSVIKKCPSNPILTAADLPYPGDLVFNAGVCKYQGQYITVFRNDYGMPRERFVNWQPKSAYDTPFDSLLGIATSPDGIHWTVREEPLWQWKTDEISRAYDPRLTVIEDELFLCFAVDSKHGIRGGIAKIHDLKDVEVLHLSTPDNRNMVLFPERVDGCLVRLERPFTVYSRGGKDRFDLWMSRSPDGRYWGDCELVLGVEDVPFANDKIGPAAPPIRTPRGWLTTFHAVYKDTERNLGGWEPTWYKEYTGGLMLLDLENPSKVIGMCREPFISSDHPYECEGFRNHVIFPGGMILEEDGEVKIYYGAADTVEALATAQLDDLLDLCEPFER